ncbi:MAG: sigma 54-interacting transcriptional regulator [Prolixibacteraceae bacterium]|nr:sigma 54-interacting transcriptional regulator [Prolixibacteraceae bacterium]
MQNDTDIQKLSYFTLNQSNEPFFWIDKEGTVQHVNPAAMKLSGFEYDEIVGTKIYDLHPDENEQIWKERWEKLKKEKRIVFEKKQPKEDGTFIDIEVAQNYVEFEGHAYTVSLVKEKTKEYAIRNKLIESERRLSTLMANLPGMAYRCLLDKNWTMEFISKGCEKLTGYLPDELMNNHILSYQDLIHKEDRLAVWELVNNGVEQHKPFQIKYRIKTATGEEKWVWEQGSAVRNENDEIVALEGFITDITENKKAEQELIEKEKIVRELKDKLQEETVYLQEEIKLTNNFEEIITKSPKFRKVLTNIQRVSSTDSTVLIQGETGTGKELIARAIHNTSNRSDRVLIKVNCAALAPELIESELFGHEKGAFTGAYNKKAGRFELANKGTIFLDEIGELPLNLQVKLLRVLQEGEFDRLGGTKTIKTDVRVIAATNRNLEKAVEKGDFREDLFYRLNVFPVFIPPLRERKEDIPLLVHFFVKRYASKTGRQIKETSEKVLKSLSEYHWPGNVRELENIIERAVVLCTGKRLIYGDWIPENKIGGGLKLQTLKENERNHILKALETTNWRISGEKGAAKLLDMKRTTLESRMNKLGINRPR